MAQSAVDGQDLLGVQDNQPKANNKAPGGICNTCCTSCFSFLSRPSSVIPDPIRTRGPGRPPVLPEDAEIADMAADAFESLDRNDSDLMDMADLASKKRLKKVEKLNRYSDVVPKRHSAVRLSLLDGKSETTYINASFIHGVDGWPMAYIATQGPKEESMESFWRMVWEKGATVIVMLTDLVEGHRAKCARYWPKYSGHKRPSGSATEHQYGQLTVSNIAEEKLPGRVVRSTLRLRRAFQRDDAHLIVHHFWYRGWHDWNVPGETDVCERLLQEVQLCGGQSDSGPWVVHCSAGVGRTGAFLAMDMGMRVLAKTHKVDLLDIIADLRKDRAGLVQTAAQAEFARNVLVSMLDHKAAGVDCMKKDDCSPVE
mmetsp:Transcript_19595/g.45571  ORF Transcript_19595/g.45571 Transcript_19595/m.45571 type:complete len:370 (+) Transcript_19595:138-1247(+)|eukprot:CAMPEP_0178395680 /NCGR_PEP_ID=MMETSP0689_2-20121128/13343_1 /TAXON_ID=160604 /ORGANISM="Amphidinium massartii, Strain CS-259" /LENGTH=369 /DNA_ID=CAMNT_0020016341 /DNA_START=126 /DNA_END=1235 /DNA_ORIENTATION=+